MTALKKQDKDDYTVAKAWRPISLLATLGKLLESVVAELFGVRGLQSQGVMISQ